MVSKVDETLRRSEAHASIQREERERERDRQTDRDRESVCTLTNANVCFFFYHLPDCAGSLLADDSLDVQCTWEADSALDLDQILWVWP